MSPGVRKFALTAHVISSVGWLGAVAVFLALAVAGLTSDDAETVRAVYMAAEPITWYVIVPLALASLVTGIVQSLGTVWGLFRHYWVLFKLLIATVATVVLLVYTQTVTHFADLAESNAELSALRAPTFVLHSGAALVLLVTATVLAVYKPRGMTPYGLRRHRRNGRENVACGTP
jgi:predicted secreted protein